MANYDEVVSLINGNIYPHVARTADPLLVRPDMLSLMVGDIVYNARIKNGLGAKGFMIYVNGNGAPVYEKIATTNADATSEFGISFNSSTGSAAVKDEDVKKALELKAKEWLDGLEKAIAKEPSDSAIKKAIDRMCWQLHYDITESHTNFPEVFANNDFADVQIDRYPLDTTYWDGYTLKSTISDAAGVVRESDQPSSHTIIEKGYFSDSAENLKIFDSHLTTDSYKWHTDDDNNVIVDRGSIKTFEDRLIGGMYVEPDNTVTQSATKIFCDYFTKGITELTTTTNVKDGALHVLAEKIVPDDVVGGKTYYSISECLRDHDTINGKETFSIARSLREGTDEDSVSQATHDQTQLEDRRFTSLDNNIGDFSIGTDPDDNPIFVSLAQRIGEPLGENGVSRISEASKDTLFDAIYRHPGRVQQNVNGFSAGFSNGNESVSSNIKASIVDKIGDTSTSGTMWYDIAQTKSAIGTPSDIAGTGTVFGRIGIPSRTLTSGDPASLFAETEKMYEAMFGRSGSYGFVGGPTENTPDSTFYVKSRGSSSGTMWSDSGT